MRRKEKARRRRRLGLLAWALVVASATAAGAQVPVGDELRLATKTVPERFAGESPVWSPGGSFLTVWGVDRDTDQVGTAFAGYIEARWFDAAGGGLGNPFQVVTPGDWPRAAADTQGNTLIALGGRLQRRPGLRSTDQPARTGSRPRLRGEQQPQRAVPEGCSAAGRLRGGLGCDAARRGLRLEVFAGGLTNVGVTLGVTDMVTGQTRTYRSDAGSAFQPILDTGGLAVCGKRGATRSSSLDAGPMSCRVTGGR